jgi:hypothetical protein
VGILVANFQVDDLVRSPARLLDLFQRLPLLLVQPRQPVLEQLNIVLRALTRVAHVQHV